MKKQVIRSYIVVYEKEPYGGYSAEVPALNGIVTQGDTLEDAQYMAQDMVEGYLQVLVKDGDVVPEQAIVKIGKNMYVSIVSAMR
ncbi:MAG: type II toxin-antitoxin system HicB family antitoxin [Patescibacteria group bacterium]